MANPMTHVNLPRSLALIAAFTLVPAIVHADVRYTMEMKMGGGASQDIGEPASKGSIRTTTFLKDMREREETAMDFGGMSMKTVTITQCDNHQEIKLDDDLKIYTVAPIGALQFGARQPASPMDGGRQPESVGGGGAGKETVTFTAKDLGTEKVADIDARHAMITFRTQSSGCAGDGDHTSKFEIWTAPIKASLNCPERYAATRVIPSAKGCQITYEMKGDLAGLRDITGQMAVKQIFYDGDKPVMTRDLREHSTAPLDEALFDIPADYRKVSEEEFQKQQQQKMMKRFMHGGMPQGAPADAPAAPEGDAPAGAPGTSQGGAPAADPPPADEPKKGKHGRGFKIPHLPF